MRIIINLNLINSSTERRSFQKAFISVRRLLIAWPLIPTIFQLAENLFGISVDL